MSTLNSPTILMVHLLLMSTYFIEEKGGSGN